MAVVVRNVDNIAEITGKDFIIELEYIEFVDDTDRKRKFKISGLCPISATDCKVASSATEWDEKNFHFVVDIDSESEFV